LDASGPPRQRRADRLVKEMPMKVEGRQAPGAQKRVRRTRQTRPPIARGARGRAFRDEQLVAWATEVFCFKRSTEDADSAHVL
jgi:hypothetical protein